MSRTIFVIDDDPALREGMTDILADAGYNVEGHAAGGPALERLRESPAQLVIMDFNLPDGSGIEWASKFRDVQPGLPIFLITGFVHADLPEHAGVAIDQVLSKPVSPPVLLRLIEKSLAQ